MSATHSNTLSFRSCTDTEGVRDVVHSNPDRIENALIDTGYGGLHVNMTTASRHSSTSPVCDFRRYEPFCAGMIREVWYTSVHRASVGWMLRPYQANFRTKVLTAVMGFDHFRVRGAVPSTAQKLDTRFLGFAEVEVGTSSPSYGLRTGRSAGQHPGHLGLRSLPYFSLDVIPALNPSPGIGQHPLVATKCLSVVDHCSPGVMRQEWDRG